MVQTVMALAGYKYRIKNFHFLTVTDKLCLQGATLEGSNSGSASLRNVKLKIYNETFCSDVFPKLDKNWNSLICAGT